MITGRAYQVVLLDEGGGFTLVFESGGGELTADEAVDWLELRTLVEYLIRTPGRELRRLEHGECFAVDIAGHNIFIAYVLKDLSLLLGTVVEVEIAAYDDIFNTCLFEEVIGILHLLFAYLC